MRNKKSKDEYFKKLREEWQASKKLAEQDKDQQAKFEALRSQGFTGSYYSYFFTAIRMKTAGLSGQPYVDMKTFKGWIDSGFMVKKGQKSKMKGITWLKIEKKGNEDDSFLLPKEYALFHKTQVEKFTK